MPTDRLILLILLLPLVSSCHYFLGSYGGTEDVSHGYVEGVTPANAEIYNERTYPTVQASWDGPGGDKVWLAVNLGATRPPDLSVDDSPTAAGWYFQFNRKQGYYHNGDILVPRWRTTSIDEDSNWLPERDPCKLLLGGNWRLPVIEELRAFRTAPAEQGGLGEGNRTSAFNSVLRLHAAGYLKSFTGELEERGFRGSYWASDQFRPDRGEVLGFANGSNTFGGNKAIGRNVRCVMD